MPTGILSQLWALLLEKIEYTIPASFSCLFYVHITFIYKAVFNAADNSLI